GLLFAPLSRSRSHCDGGPQRPMALIVGDLEIVVDVFEQRRWLVADDELRQWKRRPRKLSVDLVQVVEIEVAVAAGPDEVAHAEVALLRNHVRQKSVRSDIERHPQEDIRTALVHLARQASAGNIELEQQVARWQLHARD